MFRLGIAVALIAASAGEAKADDGDLSCREALTELGVSFESAKRRGVRDGVSLSGKIGGVLYRSYSKDKKLVIDCSLAVSLALSAPYFAANGITEVRYSSAYQRRYIRGTKRLSSHSFGLSIDLHTFRGAEVGKLTIRDDYEQGLGDNVDCVGDPLTEGGLVLRRVWCQLSRSELFRIILDPDFDADHYNHLHVEALPWDDRKDLDLIAERVARASAARARTAAR